MLKHLTLSSGCMQKQQWMLHLYWIEVIRRHFLSFHFPSPLPQTVSVLRVWSGVRGCAPPRRTEPKQPVGRSGLFSPTPSPLFFSSSPALKSKGVGGGDNILLFLLPPLFLQKNCAGKQCKQKEETKTPEEEEKKHDQFHDSARSIPEKDASQLSAEM